MTLCGRGFPLETVYDLPLDTLYLYAEGANRLEARDRMSYISDTSNAVASVLGGGKAGKEHFESLKNMYEGKSDGD